MGCMKYDAWRWFGHMKSMGRKLISVKFMREGVRHGLSVDQ